MLAFVRGCFDTIQRAPSALSSVTECITLFEYLYEHTYLMERIQRFRETMFARMVILEQQVTSIRARLPEKIARGDKNAMELDRRIVFFVALLERVRTRFG